MDNQRPTTFPTVPPSLSAGDHGMRDHYASAQADAWRPTLNTVQNITPYLGLRSRLSQVWINRWTILLFLILARTLIAIAGLNHDLASAKTEAMSACSGVESMGSALASMPHYLSAGVNELAASGVEKAVHGLMSMLLLTITGVEEIIVFYINMLTSTYMCLITLAVAGSLHVALQVVEDAAKFLNTTLKGISDDIGNTVNGFQTDFNKFVGTLNSVPKVFGGSDGSLPKIDLSKQQSELTSLQLPSNLDEGLTKLNNSIPTFQDVQNFTDNVIRLPFEEVKKLVNGTLSFSFNRSLLPVPDKKQLTFCSDNNEIASFFDNLAALAIETRKVFIAVLLILALAVCIPMAYQEMRRWRKMKERAELVDNKSLDPLDVIYIASRPYTASAGIQASKPFTASKQQILARWVVAYATSTPALLVLSLAITGLISCLCQYILLKAVQKAVPALANEVGAFADKVVGALTNASASWANDTNSAISNVNNDINNDVFGWVNTSTHAVNDTLNAFINQTTQVLNTTFGGTVLYDPITELFNCLVGLKVDSFEKGLTWVSDNAKIDFPLLPNDTFSLGAAQSITNDTPANASQSFLAAPGSETTDKITNAVAKVTTHLADTVRTEAIISTCLLMLWVAILLMGVARAVWLCLRPGRNRAEGGPAVEEHDLRPFSLFRGPAPAYEPPKSLSVNPFDDPIRQNTPRVPGRIDDDEWQDRKLGFAGLREPVVEESPSRRGQRESVYPTVEKT